jgi:hypothetical protein
MRAESCMLLLYTYIICILPLVWLIFRQISHISFELIVDSTGFPSVTWSGLKRHRRWAVWGQLEKEGKCVRPQFLQKSLLLNIKYKKTWDSICNDVFLYSFLWNCIQSRMSTLMKTILWTNEQYFISLILCFCYLFSIGVRFDIWLLLLLPDIFSKGRESEFLLLLRSEWH